MARAAQFSPFAALTGYDDEVQETARLTDMFAVMTEDQSAVLDDAFQRMLEMDRPNVTIRYFKPDSRKADHIRSTAGRSDFMMSGITF